jgi:LuxR family maltose regulon positive regulatory protein
VVQQLEIRCVSILKTKLYRQTPPVDAVTRSALLEGLCQAAERGFTLISAPAGFGKSTLVSSWLAQCALPSAWLSLDHSDSDIVVFLQYFIAAVQEVYAGACAETLALCKSAVGATPAGLTSSLINELDALPGEFVLVLDDYHVIDNQAVHELIATMILHPPRSLHLVLCSRLDPPLPLARLRAQGKMVELRSSDLRFSRSEAAAFYAHQLGYALDDATLATLDEYIEGWPVGLRLAALSIRRLGDGQDLVAALAQWRGHTLDYLFREVLSALDPPWEDALVRLSVLDRFCPELYSALCVEGSQPAAAPPDGQQFVARLQEANLFLVPLDDEGRWFRFHATFLEVLRRRSRLRYPDAEREELHRAASAWLAAAGLFDDALDHAVLANDFAAASTLVAQARYAAINAEDWSRLNRWLSLLPPAHVRQSPGLRLCQAWLMQFEFRLGLVGTVLDEISALLHANAQGIPDAERALMEAEVAVLKSIICCWSAQGDEAVAYGLQALAKAPPEQSFLRGSAFLYYCFGMQMTGKGAAGIASLLAALESEGRVSSTFTARIMIAAGGSHWMLADVAAALRIARQGLAVAQDRHLAASHSWLCMLLSSIHYQRNELETAAGYCRALFERPHGAHPIALGHTYLVMALVEQAHAGAGAAQPWVDKAYALAVQTGVAPLLYQVEAVQARLNLANGEAAAAKMWATTRREKYPPVMPVFLSMPELVLARVLLQEPTGESLHLAAGALRAGRALIEKTHNVLHEIELLALEAVLYAASGQASKAQVQLMCALKLAEPGGIVRFFVDSGPALAGQLKGLAQRQNAPAYARRVLQAFEAVEAGTPPAGAAVPSAGGTLVEPLTNRELEVLALLNERLSNKEIAQLLFLSPQTVKSHVHHILEKLEVGHRREAVARARSLGLLHP